MLLALLVGGLWLGTPAVARAEPIPRATDGEGITLGQRSTFHAGFALGAGVDTNVFQETSEEQPRPSSFLYPTAWLGIGNRQVRDGLLMSPPERSARIVDYSLGLIGGFRQYLSRYEHVRNQPRFSIGTQIRLNFLPGRRFSINVAEDFYRGANPANIEIGGNRLNFNRITHLGTLTLIGRPGGGRLSLALGYRSQFLRFGSEEVNKGNRMMHGLFHETKWRFLPKSSLVFQYTFDWTYYLDCCTDIGQGRNEDNYAHRLMGGYRGQVLKKLVFEAMAGWGFGYYRDDPNGPNFNSVIGQVALSYYPTLRSLVHVSGFRSFNDSVFGNYFVDNGGRLALMHQFRWRMIARLGAAVMARTYHGLPLPLEEDVTITGYAGSGDDRLQRRTTLATLDAGVEQPLGRIWSLALNYTLLADAGDFRVDYINDDSNQLGFVKHVILFLASVRI